MSDQVFSDRYQIVRHLARGGMAEVYLARDLLLDRPVALKVLFPEFASDRSFVERFRREARSAARLNHPNVVSIYDSGEEGGTYFIVMEYVDGRTLRDIIRKEGPLHPTRAAEIGAEIAGALAFAHRNNVIHRDIKPGNILMSSMVKVGDFGISRAADPSEGLTQTGAVMGTATYFSPEQAQGQAIDPRSDLYSLGVVLYEMVAGRPPFSGESPVAIAYQHVREPPVPPSRHNPDVPPAFDAIVTKCLAKNRANRYMSADALRADLVRFAHGQPVNAEPLMPPPISAARATLAARQGSPDAIEGTQVMRAEPPGYDDGDDGDGGQWEPVEERRTGHTWIYIMILVVLLGILGGLLFLLARELGVGNSTEVVVPPVVGKSQQDAVDQLDGIGLRAVIRTQPDDRNDPGKVIDQDPDQGAKLAKGSTVTLVVAGAPETVDVPDVRTRSVTEATQILESRLFLVRTTSQFSDRVPANEVIDQNPKPGKAPKGSTITLIVSSGPDEVIVPLLTGVAEADAAKTLTDRGFRVSRRTATDPQVASGLVIRTEPGAGTPLARGATVTLVVSEGPPPTTTSTPTTSTSTSTTSTTRPTTTTTSGNTTTSRP